jgi:transposase
MRFGGYNEWLAARSWTVFLDFDATLLLPTPDALFLLAVTVDDGAIACRVDSTRPDSPCPGCGVLAKRIHSRYRRQLADLPWGTHSVSLALGVRRFFCDEKECEQRIFTERLPDLAGAWARRTLRLEAVFRLFGLALGGQAGARLAGRIHAETSPDTVLRLVLATPTPGHAEPRVLGVDDWAWRKGHTYGTVLVDLERRQVLDLLPDRTADTLAAWLKAHPSIEIIARDRAGAYADGARRGAPCATQVADRFHLLKNVTDMLKHLVDRRWSVLLPHLNTPIPLEKIPLGEAMGEDVGRDSAPVTSASRARRLAEFAEVRRLRAEGLHMEEVARVVGISYRTVRLFLRAESFPERAPRWSLLNPFVPYLCERWGAGCRDGKQLLAELKARGYPGSKSVFYDWMARELKTSLPRAKALQSLQIGSSKPPTPRQVTWRLARPAKGLKDTERNDVERWCGACPQLAEAYALTQQLSAMIRQRTGSSLDGWLDAATASCVAEVRGLAAGIKRDQAAVQAAMTLQWSTGQVEGQNNRLKLLKRQTYGRAGFQLLRQRVLHAH